jgi:DNA invertase Pin-like site-specific DNA recombinase
MQLRELREYAARRGWTLVSEYIDHGVSGSKDSRPQLNRMMTVAHRREFDAVVVRKIDRLCRSLKHLVTALADLAAYGVAFVSLRNNLDLSTPSGGPRRASTMQRPKAFASGAEGECRRFCGRAVALRGPGLV